MSGGPGRRAAVGVLAAVVLVLGAGGPAPSAAAAPKLEVLGLTTDHRVDPLADDSATPVLGWQLRSSTRGERQTGYQLQVWTVGAETDRPGPVWDSGRVDSSDQVDVAYAGPAPQAATRYHWRARVWGATRQPSAWSQAAWWETGLEVGSRPAAGPDSWSGAQSIGATRPSDAPLLRKEFVLAKPVASARAYVFGLGWYELHLDGRKVDDRVLTPADTQYQQTLQYDTYDVTDDLRPGANAVGAWLGNGYGATYTPNGWRWLGPKQVIVKLAIRFTDGTTTNVVSDPSWTWSDGPITANDIYNGETYDARLERPGWDGPGYHEAGWQAAAAVAVAPSGRLTAGTVPPIRVTQTVRPVALTRPRPGVYVFDMGVNIAGWARLDVSGAPGTRVQVRHSEDVGADGMIDPTTNRNAAATDVYILGDAGPVQTHEPRFTYHGFRYVELTGYPGTVTLDTLAGRSIHADLVSTGTFRSSDPLLDRIHANARRSILNNTMSIPTDNPVRDERGPAAMDVQAYAEAAARNFDVRAFYTGYLENLAGQGLSTSGFFTPAGSPDMNGTPVLLTWLLYEQYGDKGTLVRYYPYLAAYVDSLAQAAPGGIWPDGNGWGDWCPPPPAKLAAGAPVGGYTACLSERPLVNTALYFRAAGLMAGMAAVVGRPADAARYRALADRIETAFNAHFLDAAGDGYGDGRQATSVLPLAFGLVPDERLGAVRNRLISTVSATGGDHVDTGIFGTRYLLDALQGAGQADASLAVLDQTGYPGFGDQIRLGATTMWEEWPLRTPMETHDHAMFAGIDASLYTGFAGITPLEPGYGRIRIRPSTPTALHTVDAGLDTVRGTVSSRWTETKGHWRLTVHIPVNATAEIDIPLTGDGASSIHAPSSAERLRAGGAVAVFAVGSGTYTFTRGGTKGAVPGWAVVAAGGSIVGLGLLALRRRRRRAHR